MKYKKIATSILIGFCLIIIAELIRAYLQGDFNSVDSFRDYMKDFGIFAPVILTVIQALQVVIPVLPGWLGCTAGGVMFGLVGGFLCNYIGISLGSIAAFILAKKYGTKIVEGIFPKEKIRKYSKRAAKSRSYTAFLFAGMVLPLFPDDFFCYFSGLTKMSVKKFVFIVLLGKPWCILAYSILSAQV